MAETLPITHVTARSNGDPTSFWIRNVQYDVDRVTKRLQDEDGNLVFLCKVRGFGGTQLITNYPETDYWTIEEVE